MLALDDAVCAEDFALAAEGVDEVGEGFHGLARDAFVGAGADVRGDDAVGGAEERVVGWRGFLVQDVGAVAADFFAVEGFDHVRGFDDFAACAVEDDGAVLHGGDGFAADEATGFI